MRLLLIEDNVRLASLTAEGLRKAGFAVDLVHSAEEASAALAVAGFDAVLLDLGLPDADGLTLLSGLRDRADATPVLILTARDRVDDRVRGLNLGADDYLLKPFALEELVARIRALLRRPGAALGVVLQLGNIAFDSAERLATVGGRPLDLSRRELDALELLLRRAGRVVPKSALENGLYGFGEEIGSNAVEVLIHRLRKRLLAAGASAGVQTLRGIGYILIESPAGSDAGTGGKDGG
ncbi:transcriptional regulator [Azospirillum thiophilum]|uniref:Transcriptional regulator n=1 Tax=Azospirillum thiophilum TaxID=528244 RepID=A0AAC8VUU7_9PROT|nr:response regulator transcription factor [Azospirillum thiophilum]ALG69889.1 transcriptional regulator [Azospirillum thiophilum]KJR66425.1 transcriptional regulator [Azospirillum thiophilum]